MVGGKSLRDLAATKTPIGETTVCELHRRIVLRSQPDIAGVYSRLPRRNAGSPVVFPNPARIPDLMQHLGSWLSGAPGDPTAAFEGHFKLTAIHPFADGNGRAARLMMNLILLRGGYPPIAVHPEDRKTYLDTLEHGSRAEDLRPFQTFMHGRRDATLDAYLAAFARSVACRMTSEPRNLYRRHGALR